MVILNDHYQFSLVYPRNSERQENMMDQQQYLDVEVEPGNLRDIYC